MAATERYTVCKRHINIVPYSCDKSINCVTQSKHYWNRTSTLLLTFYSVTNFFHSAIALYMRESCLAVCLSVAMHLGYSNMPWYTPHCQRRPLWEDPVASMQLFSQTLTTGLKSGLAWRKVSWSSADWSIPSLVGWSNRWWEHLHPGQWFALLWKTKQSLFIYGGQFF